MYVRENILEIHSEFEVKLDHLKAAEGTVPGLPNHPITESLLVPSVAEPRELVHPDDSLDPSHAQSLHFFSEQHLRKVFVTVCPECNIVHVKRSIGMQQTHSTHFHMRRRHGAKSKNERFRPICFESTFAASENKDTTESARK